MYTVHVSARNQQDERVIGDSWSGGCLVNGHDEETKMSLLQAKSPGMRKASNPLFCFFYFLRQQYKSPFHPSVDM
jgi:hypothetical protein